MPPETVEKFKRLYIKVNEMLAYLGAEGEVTATDTCVEHVFSALHDLDGGEYDVDRVFNPNQLRLFG